MSRNETRRYRAVNEPTRRPQRRRRARLRSTDDQRNLLLRGISRQFDW